MSLFAFDGFSIAERGRCHDGLRYGPPVIVRTKNVCHPTITANHRISESAVIFRGYPQFSDGPVTNENGPTRTGWSRRKALLVEILVDHNVIDVKSIDFGLCDATTVDYEFLPHKHHIAIIRSHHWQRGNAIVRTFLGGGAGCAELGLGKG